MSVKIQRYEDISRRGCLRLFRQNDGDMIVVAVPDPGDCDRRGLPPFGIGVEFCVSGGQSPHTREALLVLWEAIEMSRILKTGKMSQKEIIYERRAIE